jgi:starch phosphorylase
LSCNRPVLTPAAAGWTFEFGIGRAVRQKRQLLNVLHIVTLYNRLRDGREMPVARRTFFFAGKAVPA